jgi:hypothetical protein
VTIKVFDHNSSLSHRGAGPRQGAPKGRLGGEAGPPWHAGAHAIRTPPPKTPDAAADDPVKSLQNGPTTLQNWPAALASRPAAADPGRVRAGAGSGPGRVRAGSGPGPGRAVSGPSRAGAGPIQALAAQ